MRDGVNVYEVTTTTYRYNSYNSGQQERHRNSGRAIPDSKQSFVQKRKLGGTG